MTGVFKAFFGNEVGKYCLCVIVEIRKYQSLRVISFGTSSRPNGLGIIAGFGNRITLLESKNFCETITPFMSLLLVRVSRGPLCTYLSTLCVYHVPLKMAFECGRIFSFTKRFIPTHRNRLKDDVIEAMSCLKHWYRADDADNGI
jgi:hypothetical protein